jgi:hypothetical protein
MSAGDVLATMGRLAGQELPRHRTYEWTELSYLQQPAASAEQLSEAQRRRWCEGPLAARLWKAGEDELVKTLPPGETAQRTGRRLHAVYARRLRLGLSDGRAEGQARRRGKPRS